jgi:phosphoribosylanthranilate isomerase
VTPERAKELCANVPASVLRIAVMRHPHKEHWERVIEIFEPNWLQTDADDFRWIKLPKTCTALPVYRDSNAPADSDLPDRLLFEGTHSGSGRVADWDEANGLAHVAEVILAGGLTADNVTDAVRFVRPWGVDVSSGVERAPGEKDPEKIKEFVARVRAIEV